MGGWDMKTLFKQRHERNEIITAFAGSLQRGGRLGPVIGHPEPATLAGRDARLSPRASETSG